MTSAIISALFALGALGILLVMRSERNVIRARFADRETISLGQFVGLLDDANVQESCVGQGLLKLSSIFGVDQGKIRPDDRFDSEFSPLPGSEFDSPLEALRLEVAHEAKKHGIDVEEIKIDTVRDYIAFVQKAAAS